MTRPVRALFVVGAVLTVAGAATCAMTIYTYLSEPLALSSTSGLMVFYQSDFAGSDSQGTLVQYAPFVFGAGPGVLVMGLVVLLASIALSAALYSPARRR
jgi:hypothetical protein